MLFSLILVLFSSSPWFDLHVTGAPTHEASVHAFVRCLQDLNSQVILVELFFIGLGWEYALPSGTHHGMSMGRVG